jgi:L-ascorbate metabolism protein UlaG (beta-lactamase superfamily)
MQVEWYGQSAFRLEVNGQSVVIDPFGDIGEAAATRGMPFEYPPISGVTADLVLVTHEHFDHNGVEVVEGDPEIIRSRAGTHESPVGEVVGVASEHDPWAGTKRGPNTIFVFSFGGVRVCHFGDFGQSSLRDEQAAAIGSLDLLFVPVGGGPTIDAAEAVAVVERLSPRWVVPMHYRTPRVGFLEPADAFLDRMPAVERLATPVFDTDALPGEQSLLVVVPAVP